MNHLVTDIAIDYDGSQLRSGWVREISGMDGEAILAFIGACDVKPEFMVDMEDLEANASIYSTKMLHFIAEHPSATLTEVTLRQRLMVCIIKEVLEGLVPGLSLRRSGDDLYDADGKLSVSIATVSPASGLIHTGLNISSKDTPVVTKCLNDYGIDAKMAAAMIVGAYAAESDSVAHCLTKVKRVP